MATAWWGKLEKEYSLFKLCFTTNFKIYTGLACPKKKNYITKYITC